MSDTAEKSEKADKPEAAAPATTEKAAPAKSKLPMIIAVVVILALAGGGGFFYYSKTKAAEKAKTEKKTGKTGKVTKDEEVTEDDTASEDDTGEEATDKSTGDKAEPDSSEVGKHIKEVGEKTLETMTDPTTGKPVKKPFSIKSLALPADKEVKHIIELQPFILNLADDNGSCFLRISLSIGIAGEAKAEAKPDPLFIARLRNALLAVMMSKSSQEILNDQGKTILRKQLLAASRAVVKEEEVSAVYITEFIVQK